MYKIEIKNTGSYSFDVVSGNQSCAVDMKPGGMTPPGMLLAGLGSCVGVYIRKYADGAKLALGEFKVTVEADFTKDSPARFQEIRVAIDLKGAVLDDRRKKALVDFVRNCPVHNTLKASPAVDIAIG